MSSLSRRDREFDGDLWMDLAARLLGVAAAFGLAALGLVLIFPAAGAGHLPALPLGPAEPQRPLIGLLCFALSGLVVTAVMLFRTSEPPIRKPQSPPRGMNLSPAGPTEPPPLAPFPAAQPWRPPQPPLAEVAPVELTIAPEPEPAAEPATPPAPPEIAVAEEAAAADVPALVQSETIQPEIEQLDLAPEPPPIEIAPLVADEPVETRPPAEPPPAPIDEDFETRRQKLKATLGEASALAAALSAQATGDHQQALAAQDVGDAALASGAPHRAADAYDRALLHARTLMEAHPNAPAVRSVLAEVLAKIGDLNAVKGRMGAALGAYEEAISHRREAVRLGEGETGRLDLAAALENLARLRQSRGETDKARALYTESLDHLAPLAAADPRHGDMAYRAKLSLLALDKA